MQLSFEPMRTFNKLSDDLNSCTFINLAILKSCIDEFYCELFTQMSSVKYFFSYDDISVTSDRLWERRTEKVDGKKLCASKSINTWWEGKKKNKYDLKRGANVWCTHSFFRKVDDFEKLKASWASKRNVSLQIINFKLHTLCLHRVMTLFLLVKKV